MSSRVSSVPSMLAFAVICASYGVSPAHTQELGSTNQAAKRAIAAVHERLVDSGAIRTGGGVVVAQEMIGEGFGAAGVDRRRAEQVAEGFAQRLVSMADVLVCSEDAPRMRNCSLDAESVFQLGPVTVAGRAASVPLVVWATSPEGMVFMQMRKVTLEHEGGEWRVVKDELVGVS